MALDNYTDLQAAIGDWLNRTDLTGRIPDFILLTEAEIERRLRRTTVQLDTTFGAEINPLPPDCAELRSVRLTTGVPEDNVPIKIVTEEVLSEFRAIMTPSGWPVYGSILTGNLVLVPIPDTVYSARIRYYQRLVPLATAPSGVNIVLQEAPDLYLFGALKNAEPFLENDERVEMWSNKFEAALAQLDAVREREEYGASLRPMRLSRVF